LRLAVLYFLGFSASIVLNLFFVYNQNTIILLSARSLNQLRGATRILPGGALKMENFITSDDVYLGDVI